MHVPIHNDQEVSAFVSVPNGAALSFENIQSWTENGLRGVSLQPLRHDTSSSLMDTIGALKQSNVLEFLVPLSLLNQHGREKFQGSQSATVLFEYSPDILTKDIASCEEQSIATSIVCRSGGDLDALEMASGVAQLLDDTGGGKYLCVAGDDSDDIVELCEELSYLDVAGPTMKSRIIVDLPSKMEEEALEEAVEEWLLMGINKFILEQERLDWFGGAVRDQGKNPTFL